MPFRIEILTAARLVIQREAWEARNSLRSILLTTKLSRMLPSPEQMWRTPKRSRYYMIILLVAEASTDV